MQYCVMTDDVEWVEEKDFFELVQSLIYPASLWIVDYVIGDPAMGFPLLILYKKEQENV